MKIYRYETGLLITGGTGNFVTHKINGGLCHQIHIETESTGTVYRARLLDARSNTVLNYAWITGELNDLGRSGPLPIPMLGTYIIQIRSASLITTCSVNLLVEE